MPDSRYQTVTILGVGLIGGSVALALRERGLAGRVIGYARSQASQERLSRLGVVDEVQTDLDLAVQDADVVLIATPVETISVIFAAILKQLKPGAIVTDAGSTKRSLVGAIEETLDGVESSPNFVGAHPMAGDHQTGAEAARADLFDGALTILTPNDQTTSEATKAAESFWQALGCRTVAMSPAEHDQLVARASHVPHVAAAALAATTPDAALPLTATGWGDTTRVAAGSPELWREILLSNRDAIRDGLRDLQNEIEAYLAALENGEAQRLQKLLEQGKEARDRRDALGS